MDAPIPSSEGIHFSNLASTRPRLAIGLAAAALFLARLALLLAAPAGPFHGVYSAEGDELDYLPLAEQLRETNFTQYAIPGRTNDHRRPPLVPGLGALTLRVAGKGSSFISAWCVFQLALYSLAFALALDAARRLHLRPWIGLAALLASLDLVTLGSATRFYSEATYTVLLALAIWSLPLGEQMGAGNGRSFLAGLFTGLATLARPIAQFFVVPAAVLCWASGKPRGGRRHLLVGILLLGFLLPVLPWVARNNTVLGRPFVSEIGKLNLYLYWAAQAEAWETGRTLEEVQTEYETRLKEATQSDPTSAKLRQEFFSREAWKVLGRHPLVFPRFFLRAVYPIFLGRATSTMNTLYGQPPVGVGGHLRRGGPLPFLLLILAEAVVLPLTLGLWVSMAGRAILRRRENAMAVLLFLLPVAYHLMLSWGPEANARFRIPFMPWLIVLAACLPCVGKKNRETDATADSTRQRAECHD